jgi:hypothetical protein
MPHVPFRAKPLATGQTPPIRSRAPLASPPTSATPSELPALPDGDILDLPVAPAPVRTDRPQVPFAAPRKRERKSNSLLPSISMKSFKVSPDDVVKHLFGGGE